MLNVIFFKNQAPSVFWYYKYLSRYQKSEKNNEPLMRYCCDGLTDNDDFIAPFAARVQYNIISKYEKSTEWFGVSLNPGTSIHTIDETLVS